MAESTLMVNGKLRVTLHQLLGLDASTCFNSCTLSLCLLDLNIKLLLLLSQFLIKSLELFVNCCLLVLKMARIFLVLAKAKVEPCWGTSFLVGERICLCIRVILACLQDQRLELQLSGHIALIYELMLLLYLILDLNELSLEVFGLEMEVTDLLVELEQLLLVLRSKLLWCCLLRVLEDCVDIFELIAKLDLLDLQVLDLLSRLS